VKASGRVFGRGDGVEWKKDANEKANFLAHMSRRKLSGKKQNLRVQCARKFRKNQR
jgi:hypothetical protein